MGYLKGRFCSLKSLRQQIDDERDHLCAVEWIRTCLILHTLIIRLNLEDEEFADNLLAEGLDHEHELMGMDDHNPPLPIVGES
jgi:hypothetical protein